VIGTLVASICILAYLGALVLVIVRISVDMEQRRADAGREFAVLSGIASAAGAEGFMDDIYVRLVQTALNDSRVLEGVIIASPLGSLGFERESGRALAWIDGAPSFRSRLDFSRQELFRPLGIPGVPGASIQAVAGAIDTNDLVGTLAQAAIIVGAALALSFLTMLLESPSRKGAPSAARPLSDDAPIGRTTLRSAEALREARVDRRPPSGYSARSQVLGMEHAESRLAHEIDRSAAEGQDIAFIAVEFKSARADDYYARLAADAARFFSSKEFICERGERGLSVICPGLSLDMGFLNATEFHARIMGKYPDVFAHKTDLCMGISARSERELVNAARLIFEAEEALERAMMDPASPVIAFKVDPAKYRAFMEGRRGAMEGPSR